jgi:arginine/lysine/ornithine decarboxylase
MSDKTPIYTALKDYMKSGIVHFDVPGHKKRFPLDEKDPFWSEIVRYDPNSTKELDMLSNPSGIIQEAEELMARAYKADCAYMLVNGSTFGVQAMILAACGPREKIIMPRNVHKSAVNGIILSGANPVFIEPEIDYEYGIANGITFETVKRALKEHPDAKALFLINPTYFGAASDLRSIVKLCHRHKVAVLVDEAHGAHFPFHPDFPEGSMSVGADLSTVSLHKTAGSLTQSSVMLLNEGLLTNNKVRTTINLMQTTSASYLLLASLDLARNRLETKGFEIYSSLLREIDAAKQRINKMPGLSVLTKDAIDGQGIYEYDETKLVVKVNGLGLSGFDVYDMLKKDYNIQAELAETYVVLFVVGVGDTPETIAKLTAALQDISGKYYGKIEPFTVSLTDFFEKPRTVVPPREAFFSPAKLVPVSESEGEICGESIMIYPPGIPLIIPGERITAKVLEHYDFYRRQNCIIMNDEDRTDTIKVIGE